jgi:heme-degrading monooxygenase HmoA
MIMRMWRGYTRPEDADAYDEMLRNEILPGIHRIAGYLGCYLLRREAGEEVEFVTLTMWDSWDAIEQFAGPSKTGSVIHPKAHALITHCDEQSVHYEAALVP